MPLVDVTTHEDVATLWLNRPDARNALSVELCDAIVEALAEIDRSGDARAIVVRGKGPAFCAGADLAAVAGPGALAFLPSFERMLESLARHRLPTVAAVTGAALGGGFQLATVCDFRIAASDARLGIPSSKLGILVNLENVQRLVVLAGVAVAKEVLMTGRTYDGREAEDRGLVHRVAEAADMDREVHDFACALAGRAPLSVQGSKRAIQVVVDHLSGARRTHAEAAEAIDGLVASVYESDDLQEGLKARSEKRPPRFRGR